MIRQIAFCVAGVLTISLGLGCGNGGHGVKQVEGLDPTSGPKQQSSVSGRVTQILEMLGNKDEQMATRRQRGARAATKLAADPNLTPEDKAKLIDALKKAIDAPEKDKEALPLEKEALAALEAKS